MALREGTFTFSIVGLTIRGSTRALTPWSPHLRTDWSLLLRRCHTHPGALGSPTASVSLGSMFKPDTAELRNPHLNLATNIQAPASDLKSFFFF